MKILLLGGSGFLGSSLSSLLKSNGIEYYTASRSNKNSDFNIDISDYNDFIKLPTNFFEVVINCAVILPGGNYLDNVYLENIFKTNVLGTQNICKWISEQNSIKKIINCSTLVVVSKPWPINLSEEAATYPSGNHVLYCSSKLTQELIFKTFAFSKNIVLTQIRFSSLYGSTMTWSGIICNLIDQSKNNKKISLTNATKVSADFLHVDDASKIIYATLKNDVSGIINGASGIETSILELAELVKEKFTENIEIENIENECFLEDRSVVNVDKLNNIIEVSSFISLKEGINGLISC